MTDLLELREKLKLFYSRYEAFLFPLVKFLLAFVTLTAVNSGLGYMLRLDNMAIVLIVALACSFLPVGAIVFFGVLFSLFHMYALSMEVALVGLCVYLLMFLLFIRFGVGDSLVAVITALLFAAHVPYIVPIAVGLMCGPGAVVWVICGTASYYLMRTVAENAQAVGTLGSDAVLDKIRLMLDGLVGNREMMVLIAALGITTLAVYLIRRLSVDHAWTIAMVSGALIDVMILLIGDLMYDINISVPGLLLGSLLALAVAKVLEFFRFCVDYSRTEKVQFEDDEYYYYVKAVPKMTVAMSTRTVKQINTRHARNVSGGRNAGSQGRSVQGQRNGSGRRVTTERTAGTDRRGYGSSRSGRTGDYRGGRSVTIGSTDAQGDEDSVDFDELL